MRTTVGSVCSGYGGLEMALAQVMDVDVRWHAEVDPDASKVLKTWWPEVPNLGDFTVPGWAPERVDVECGGVPCQGFSAAGRQLGAADPRHLWPDWRRGIAERRPATVVFENVANLTRGKMRPIFDSIITDLLDVGYDVRWCLLGACAVGAAHHRHRVFLLACRSRTTPNAAEVKVRTCGAKGMPTHAEGGPAVLPTPSASTYSSNRGGSEGRIGPVRHSLDALARLELLPTPRHSDAKNGGPNQGIASGDIALSSAVQPERWGQYAAAIARHEAVLGRPAPEPTEVGPHGGRRLAAAFSEWLMMLPEGHLTSVLARNPALARAGNGVVPLQAATAIRLLHEAF